AYLGRILFMAWSSRREGPQRQGRPKLVWERLSGHFLSNIIFERAKVPGGWLISARSTFAYGVSISFYPDPNHGWDGGSLP
ncbi:MAG TPA: hypothetical protein VFW40_07190, partial [Capsulimonadaceae bacterium]|nr:hypothetical protein [Capsulimonadaceae bacterium]